MQFRKKIRHEDGEEFSKIRFAWFPTRVLAHTYFSDTPRVLWVWLERYLETKRYNRLPGPDDFWSVRRKTLK